MKKILVIFVMISVVGIIGYNILFLEEEVVNPQEIEALDGKLAMYFKKKDEFELEKEYRNVSMKRIAENIGMTIVEEVLKGPLHSGFVSTIPSGTTVNSVEIHENVAVVDLSKEFIDNQEGNATESLLAVYSIVNSLTEITEIGEVEFLIDGQKVEKYKEYFEFNKPFLRST